MKRFRPAMECLEAKELLSTTPLAPALLDKSAHGAAAPIPSSSPEQLAVAAARPAPATGPSSTTVKTRDYQYYRYGVQPVANALPTTALTGGVALEGGSTDIDQVYTWMGGKADHGDFLVLRTSGTDAYDSYIYNLNNNPANKLNSVSTLIITSRQGAGLDFVVTAINNAEAIFIAGGDQSTYINLWQGTRVQDALNLAVNKHNVVIGGTSAGLAVLGQHVYSAQYTSSATSAGALTNPYDPSVTLVQNFLAIPGLTDTITDSHFYERDRMGRLDAFMARIVQDNPSQYPADMNGQLTTRVKGIGIDQETALFVEMDGSARVVGNAPSSDPNARHVYFMETPSKPQVCKPNTPLTFDSIPVHRASVDETFNLQDVWAKLQLAPNATAPDFYYYLLSIDVGVLTSKKQDGTVAPIY